MKLMKLLLLLNIINISFSQVNTEALRDTDQEAGIKNQLNISFSYISGSSEFIMVHGNFRSDFQSNNKWHGFFIIDHDRASEKGQYDYNNRGFAHLRIINHLKTKIYLENFLQKEYNHFIDLNNRELIGIGARFNPINKLYFGIGIMNEIEIYQYSETEYINLKSTNYINYTFNPNDFITMKNIIYYQFKSRNMQHYRILWDGDIALQASNKVAFHINLKFRYDISEINPNGDSYFEITNGLSFYF